MVRKLAIASLMAVAGLFFVASAPAQAPDNTIYVKQFRGNDVGTKVSNAMATCNPNTVIPCILVIDPSLAAYPSGTMPGMCASCYLLDYRSGPLFAGFIQGPVMFGTQLSIGDSITYGVGASSPSNGWAYLLARAAGYTIDNRGNPGYTSQQLDPVIFASSLPVGAQKLITYMVGTNNVNNGGDNADLETDFSLNFQAQLAWLAIPTSKKILFDTNATLIGPWAASSLFGASDPGSYCSGLSCQASFTVTGSTLYIVTGMAGNTNTAAASLVCDGAATGATLRFNAVNGTAIPAGTNQSSLTRVTGLGAGTHTCTVQSTSASGTIYLEWAAGLDGSRPSSAPLVFAEGIPDQSPTEAVTPKYRAFQPTAVATLQGDGLSNVQYVNNTGVLNPNTNYENQYHPNDYGHYLLAQPSIAALSSALGLAFKVPSYGFAGITNTAKYGQSNLGLGYQALGSSSLSGQQNTAIGYGAQQSMTTGSYNTCSGQMCMASMTTGYENVAYGWFALESSVADTYNTAIGRSALQFLNGGTNNVALGWKALYKSTTANYNTAAGFQAMMNNLTGAENTAIGWDALMTATADSGAVAVGRSALASQNGATGNSAVGYKALTATTTGSNNTAFGYNALPANTTGANNVAVGFQALMSSTTAGDNSALGVSALYYLTTGAHNVGIGESVGVSGAHLTTTSNSTFIGYQAGSSTDALTNQLCIGYQVQCTASNQGVFGNASVTDVFVGGTTAAAAFHASSYYAGATQGVTCTGTPSASYATVGGITTHC